MSRLPEELLRCCASQAAPTPSAARVRVQALFLLLTTAGVALQVEKIALLNTTLIKWDGSCVLYPNAKMATDMVLNINRSEKKGEVFSVSLNAADRSLCSGRSLDDPCGSLLLEAPHCCLYATWGQAGRLMSQVALRGRWKPLQPV